MVNNNLYDAIHELEKARIWGGTEWVYNPLHPRYYLKAIKLINDYIDKVESNG